MYEYYSCRYLLPTTPSGFGKCVGLLSLPASTVGSEYANGAYNLKTPTRHVLLGTYAALEAQAGWQKQALCPAKSTNCESRFLITATATGHTFLL